ncbi:MAG TPA: cytochrome d ubiquinol oxidase subunit II [Rhabdochlamydiaceae bacterium]|nr:cytochrome d ubiquinol oxidase subunit II [Rhabdochlamydiaceae bacterium]
MITLEFLQLLTYFVMMFAVIAYATLDGFDLGVGALHLLTKGDDQRRVMINAIGPVWDGNTTWIVIGSGVMFAGFPRAFANLTSGFYTATMILLFGFMLRAASIEFRSKKTSYTWRYFWDFCFAAASLILALSVGLIIGNMIEGVPLNEHGIYEGGLFQLFSPYTILVALFSLSLFTMHGSIYLLMKTEGEFRNKVHRWIRPLVTLFLALWALTTCGTFIFNPHMIAPFFNHPILSIFIFLSLGFIGGILYFVHEKKDGIAFLCSCLSIVFLLVLFSIGTFPNILRSSVEPLNRSLTLYNSSASKTALYVMGLIGLTGIPLSFFYVSYIHKVFKGKVKLDHTSY